MTTKKVKTWSEAEESKVKLLFASTDDILKKNPVLEHKGEMVTVQHISRRMLDSIEMIARSPKSVLLDLANGVSKQDVDTLNKTLGTIQKSNESVCIEFLQIKSNPIVKFWNSEIKNGAYCPPRMIIDLTGVPVKLNESMMINTGYVIRIQNMTRQCAVENGAIVKTSKIVKQPPFTIIPIVSCSSGFIIPSIYARDANDTGLLTINFTLVSGTPGKLKVVFNAYTTDRLDGVDLVDREPNAVLFKPRDSLSGRLVKNPKVKIRFEDMTVDETSGVVSFPTFDSTVTPSKTYERQRVTINSQIPIFVCSRRREWFNPELVTLSGLIMPNEKRFLAPKVLKTGDCLKNTHCLVPLKHRIKLYSETSTKYELQHLSLLNGAFVHMKDFNDINDNYKRMIFILQAMSIGAAQCKELSEKRNIPFDKLFKIFDYHRSLKVEKLDEQLQLEDAALFSSRIGNASAYSVTVLKSFKQLLNWYSPTVTEKPHANEDEPPQKKQKINV